MNPKTKTYLIAGGIALISLSAAAAFIQYKKFKQKHIIKFKGIVLNKLGLTNLDFNAFIDVTNNSDVTFNILSQLYNVSINNIFITKIENSSPVSILKGATNTIGLNVVLNPTDVYKKLGQSPLSVLTDASKLVIKIEGKLKVKMLFFTISFPLVFEKSLKDIMDAKTAKNQ